MPNPQCSTCDGSGRIPCTDCAGTGKRAKLMGLVASRCASCAGRGTTRCRPCQRFDEDAETLRFSIRNLDTGLWKLIDALPEVPHPLTAVTGETGDRSQLIALLEQLQPRTASAIPLTADDQPGQPTIGYHWEILDQPYRDHHRHHLDVQVGVSGMYYWRLESW